MLFFWTYFECFACKQHQLYSSSPVFVNRKLCATWNYTRTGTTRKLLSLEHPSFDDRKPSVSRRRLRIRIASLSLRCISELQDGLAHDWDSLLIAQLVKDYVERHSIYAVGN
jgi:hypothetical protein